MRKLVIMALVLGVAAGARADYLDDIKEGNRAYDAGDFKTAIERFQKAEAEKPEDPRLQYNIAGAAYQLGEFEKAQDYFTKALGTPDIALESKTHYNLGNTYFRMQDYPQAIKAYEDALRLDPNNVDAKVNLELARRMLKENTKPQQGENQDQKQGQDQQKQDGQNKQDPQQDQQDQQQQQQDQQQQGQDKAQQQPKEGEQDQAEKPQESEQQLKEQQISKEDAERILNALRDDERDIQEKLKRKVRAKGDYTGKDW